MKKPKQNYKKTQIIGFYVQKKNQNQDHTLFCKLLFSSLRPVIVDDSFSD